ncbi:MAG: acyl carrier protein [uncultured bacterium (gcode 4)]|uniref:Acyl carrier protein n=1 Tax=uncultured bacterium (gcode 4) TaxID=1234023 RepID=K1YXE5_9BACT|nr:MAG: acyl carrier protein [uncultured bacterium (gcode 4)]
MKKGNIAEAGTRIREVIAEELDIELENVKNESSFKGDLKVDSLDMVELLMTLEEEFEISIPEEEADKILTVQQAIDAITAKLQWSASVLTTKMPRSGHFFSERL